MTAALLPLPEWQLIDGDGNPMAGGTVETYLPGTTTPKATWLDKDQTALNTNPVVLNSEGRAIVFADGDYRIVVRDSVGNLIYDQFSSTVVSAAMYPVVSAPTIADAKALLGIDGSISDEATARANADTTETNARIAADNTLTTNLANEVTRATNAEAALSARIAALEGATAPTFPNIRWGVATTGGGGSAAITFSPPFSAAPSVVACELGPNWLHDVTVSGASTGGCTLYCYVDAGGGVGVSGATIYWVAVGPV